MSVVNDRTSVVHVFLLGLNVSKNTILLKKVKQYIIVYITSQPTQAYLSVSAQSLTTVSTFD